LARMAVADHSRVTISCRASKPRRCNSAGRGGNVRSLHCNSWLRSVPPRRTHGAGP
jgi:hypothetical protein